MLFSEVQPIFSEADAAATLFLFTVFGDKKSKSLRGSSGLGIIEVKFTKAQFEFEKNADDIHPHFISDYFVASLCLCWHSV